MPTILDARGIPVVLAALLAGCQGGYNYTGYTIHDHFPLDGDWTWQYSQEDETVDFKLLVDRVSPTEVRGTTEVVTLEYKKADTEDLLYSVKWSSDTTSGVLIHGYTDEATGETADYDPPIILGDFQMVVGDSNTVSTNGEEWVSKFVSVEDCPNYWVETWTCLKFELDNGDGDDLAGPPFAGTYWLAPNYGPSRFIPTGYADPWVLTRADWEPGE